MSKTLLCLLLTVNNTKKEGMRGGREKKATLESGGNGMRSFFGTNRAGEVSRRNNMSERIIAKGQSVKSVLGVKRSP